MQSFIYISARERESWPGFLAVPRALSQVGKQSTAHVLDDFNPRILHWQKRELFNQANRLSNREARSPRRSYGSRSHRLAICYPLYMFFSLGIENEKAGSVLPEPSFNKRPLVVASSTFRKQSLKKRPFM